MLSHTFNSMCFPNAPAYFCNTNNVGTLPPFSKRAILDAIIPVNSAISDCVKP